MELYHYYIDEDVVDYEYRALISILLAWCDTFSFEVEDNKKSEVINDIQKQLFPWLFRISYDTFDKDSKSTFYYQRSKIVNESVHQTNILDTPHSLWKWSLPEYPSNLKFYAKEEVIFYFDSCSRVCHLITDDEILISMLVFDVLKEKFSQY